MWFALKWWREKKNLRQYERVDMGGAREEFRATPNADKIRERFEARTLSCPKRCGDVEKNFESVTSSKRNFFKFHSSSRISPTPTPSHSLRCTLRSMKRNDVPETSGIPEGTVRHPWAHPRDDLTAPFPPRIYCLHVRLAVFTAEFVAWPSSSGQNSTACSGRAEHNAVSGGHSVPLIARSIILERICT